MAITEMAVFEWHKTTREMMLIEIAPGYSLEDVQKATGCPFTVSPTLCEF
jgi:acyl CoA:acetate/3-ketoacid CoA transferase beta subunit